MSYKLSQLAPFPKLKNVEVGNTIGHGGFGVVKTAEFKNEKSSKIIAVKFIHLQLASQQKVTSDQIAREAFIQKACKHQNIIEMINFGADSNWAWMAMELGSNGDLFDKIEPDLGVDEDVARFYFTQLVNAVSYIHEKGVAHRDIKPENLVLDTNGNLKLTDFGLACVFKKKNGPKRLAHTPCGSPPYVAPELCKEQYDPAIADIWSCGIVMYVLLTGKIAWEMPHDEDPSYREFLRDRKNMSLKWKTISIPALSLLMKILVPDPDTRITMEEVKASSWVTKQNEFIGKNGMCAQPLKLAAKLLVNLNVSLTDDALNSVTTMTSTQVPRGDVAGTQPVRYLMDDTVSTELLKENYIPTKGFSASQEVYTEHSKRRKLKADVNDDERAFMMISRDPAFLQFTSTNKDRSGRVTDETLQKLQQYQKRYPELFAENFTRFFSMVPLDQLLVTILEALHKLGFRSSTDVASNEIVVQQLIERGRIDGCVTIPLTGKDSVKLPIIGNIKVSRLGENISGRKVEFIKIKADPLEWRRTFKRVAVLCRDVVYVDSS